MLAQGVGAILGLLALRLAVGLIMIHHGQDKLADPAGFAANYVVPLHLPFPLLIPGVMGTARILGPDRHHGGGGIPPHPHLRLEHLRA